MYNWHENWQDIWSVLRHLRTIFRW